MSEPWWIAHARETGHDTIDDDRGGMSCSDCPGLPPISMREVHTMTLADFLLARIAEDEEVARKVAAEQQRWSDADASDDLSRLWWNDHGPRDCVAAEPVRVLAECEAKRLIVQACTTPMPRYGQLPEDYERVPTDREDVLRILAAMYADHPDYREEWKP